MSKRIIILTTAIFTLVILISGIVVVKQEVGKEKNNTTNQEQQIINQERGDKDVKELISDVNLSAEALAEVDTSDWKTYRNEEYGFEFRYPGDWKVLELDNNIGVVLQSLNYKEISLGGEVVAQGEIYMRITSNEQNLPIPSLFKTFDDTSKFWFEKYDYTENSIGGTKYYLFDKFKESENTNYRIVGVVDKQGYAVIADYVFDDFNIDIDLVYRKIIKTIK